jgi:hypothetical protein
MLRVERQLAVRQACQKIKESEDKVDDLKSDAKRRKIIS